MKSKDVCDSRPAGTSDRFLLRLVQEGDAEDLLRCYSDPASVRLMNTDNCNTDFHFQTLDKIEGLHQGLA